jgi:hypothetical protein
MLAMGLAGSKRNFTPKAVQLSQTDRGQERLI